MTFERERRQTQAAARLQIDRAVTDVRGMIQAAGDPYRALRFSPDTVRHLKAAQESLAAALTSAHREPF